ncbi:glucose-6-phosphate isomerase [Cocleimonas flava]|uniref:Glucose-6-phosphate isomerase n=1 Tax=Cocleimonas flava TaxID=634765 RepID=A0A4R1ETX0_9GAMM|nr:MULTISPECIES: glucose-6-phosphate isomerase [Cocleimonas]MEB8432773.1 glucose-6-phosphate isomerase [Cocleimonas sp. KMM 6892]MEC4715632.1 glucose-6-phosphate isomerase [Cocleimonas sp. KMM 6895]MEC4744750.1 glucose-6-phosphate isomerase [Cocleimonas sp. KMM 6896]TCJ83199.1 glucose-6-phosphate isomerase [Cocleimonas flava]
MPSKNNSKPSLTDLPAFEALEDHYNLINQLNMRHLFATDEKRGEKYSIKHKSLLLDYSKNRIVDETIPLLCDLAREVNLESWRDRMFAGDKINNTENRAVLHTALRNETNQPIYVDGEDIMPKINATIDKMEVFANKIRKGTWKGFSNRTITDIVNIGIGGSDLGPKMVYNALKPYHHKNLTVHFVSNVDGAHIDDILEDIDPETTLFIVSSKTFTTQETITNAHIARKWLLKSDAKEQDVSKHFVAVSTNIEEATKFGIDADNMFEFWDWVGGRYSLWSAIGLSIVLSVGMENFKKMLSGAHSMDEHFKETPLEENMPVIMGLLGVWYNNFFGAESHGIFPYDHYLRDLTFYLEQADMESNGKSVDRNGKKVDYATGPIIWGTSGINGQHAFYQAIHQGTQMIPSDFIVSILTHSSHQDQHDIMMANALAQTEALMKGRTLDETYSDFVESKVKLENVEDRIHHMVFEGNNPTNTLLLTKLTPRSLGMLIALYEHKIFVQGIIWNLNSFDQWGVELGKKLTKNILAEFGQPDPVTNHDSSTNSLINYYKSVVYGQD